MAELDQSDDQSDDDMFAETPVVEKPEPAVEKVEKVAVTAEEEAPAKSEQPKTTEEATPSKQDSVPMAVMIAERRKRQAAEDELRKLKGGESLDPATEAFNLTIKLSRDLILENHADYPEMEKVFMELVSEPDADGGIRITDPGLYQKFRTSANPAKFAYNHAKQHKDYLDKSSPDYEKKLREKIEAEVIEKLKKSGPDASRLQNLTNLAASANNTVQPEEADPRKDDPDLWD
jgi:hypothetical protein